MSIFTPHMDCHITPWYIESFHSHPLPYWMYDWPYFFSWGFSLLELNHTILTPLAIFLLGYGDYRAGA